MASENLKILSKTPLYPVMDSIVSITPYHTPRRILTFKP